MLFLFLMVATNPTPPVATATASATIRILQPARASEKLWHSAKRRSDQPITDDQGRKRRLRTIDFE